MDSMLTSRGKDNSQFWLSTQQFYCPIPPAFQEAVKTGEVEGLLYLDQVPIRTHPMFGEQYVKHFKLKDNTFDAETNWKNHVLPKIKQSS